MSKRRGDVWILREVLERDMSPSAVSAVLFEALSGHGSDVPSTTEGLRVLARDSLRPALGKRLDGTRVESLMERVYEALDDEDAEPEVSILKGLSTAPPNAGREADTTRAVPTTSTPVNVLVVAGGNAFERRLASALGPARVAPATAGTLRDIQRYRKSAIVLVDATSFPPIEPTDLADELAGLPETTAKCIWGADLPYGRSVLSAIEPIGISVVSITRGEGIEPLLDLIRSRRKAPSA
jgi:hypothetical protein